ncbi:MAG: class I SAM-dependent methyltransferase [Thiohalomonadaceae bacterium]
MTDRKRHWETVYTSRSPLDVSWYQAEPRLSLELIAATGLALTQPVIDVGGGASVLVDRLLDRGFTDVAVLDLSGSALAHAQQRLGARAGHVEWHEQDVTRFVAPRRFALWHDRAVFHFLTDAAEREAYVRALRRAIPVGGHVIMAAFGLDGPKQCSQLDVVNYDAPRMQAALGAEFRLMEERAEVHVTPAGKPQKLGYFRFVRVG